MLPLTLVVVTLFAAAVYYYVKNVYFTLRGPLPGMPPQFLFGNLLQTGILLRGESMLNVFLKFQAKFGDVFQFWLGPTRVIVVSCLEDVQHIFAHRHVYDQGDIITEKLSILNPNALNCLTGAKYKRHASVTIPLFRRNKILVHLNTIVDCTDKLLARWRTHYNDPTQIHLDINKQSHQLLLAIFGFIAFDYDLQTLDDKGDSSKNELTWALDTFVSMIPLCTKAPSIVSRIYLWFNLEYRRARVIIDKYLHRMIEQELEQTPTTRAERKRTSLIASLIASLQQDENVEATKPEEDKRGLSRTEVLHEMLAFLQAGYGTTSTALTWFIHLMSKHPRVQNKIKKELVEYNMQRLSVEQLDSLVYLDCVIREQFRFASIVMGTVRTLNIDDRLPASGAQLRKGEQVLIPFYNLARDKRYWSGPIDPNQFNPERFLIDGNESNNRAASIPFGLGHRQCIGQDLARLELKAICARLMQHVTFGDGGPEINAGGYQEKELIAPKNMGVTITFD